MERMIRMKKLPVGYGFNPSEKQLVNHHLNLKLLGVVDQYCLIPEFDIYKLPPWDIFTKFNPSGDGDCFVYHRPTNPNSKRNFRKTPQGSWKITGKGRKPQETDGIKWRKNYLVHQTIQQIGGQKQTVKTGWAMHEYTIISNTSIVLCRIHKIKAKKGKEKVDSVSTDVGSNGSARATAFLETQVQSQETSPEASADTTMESQNPTPSSNVNVAEYSTSSPHQTKAVADETPSPGEDAYTDFIQLKDLKDPQYPLILMREQSPCSENTFIDRSWSYPRDVTFEEGGNMSVFPQTPIVQSSNDVLLGSISPPQQPQVMHTEEISPLIGNTSFYGSSSSSSSMMYSHLNTGRGAHAPVVSMNGGPDETNFKEPPHSTLASQTLDSPTNPDLLSPEQWQMLQELPSPSFLFQASADATMESENPTPSSDINVAEYSTSSPRQAKAVADEAPFVGEDDDADFIELADLEDPQYTQIPMREQSPCIENTFIDRYDQESGDWLNHRNVTLEDGANMFIFRKTSVVQSLNDVLLGSVSPPQQSHVAHAEEISPLIGNTSFKGNGSGSGMTYSHLNIDGRDAHAPVVFINGGPDETNFKEPPQSTSVSQTFISPTNYIVLHPSDSSEGGTPNRPYFGQSSESKQTNVEMTRDFAPESPAATECTNLDMMLDSLIASSPPPEMVMEGIWRSQDSTLPGGHSNEYHGLPYSSGGTQS